MSDFFALIDLDERIYEKVEKKIIFFEKKITCKLLCKKGFSHPSLPIFCSLIKYLCSLMRSCGLISSAKRSLTMREGSLKGYDVSQIKLLRSQIKFLHSQIKLLRSQIELLRSQIKFLRSQIEFLRSQIKFLRSQIKFLRSQIELLRSQIEFLRSQIEFLRSQIEFLRSQMKFLRSQMKFLRSQIEFLRSQIKFLRSQIDLSNSRRLKRKPRTYFGNSLKTCEKFLLS